jgi:hypothetical protein
LCWFLGGHFFRLANEGAPVGDIYLIVPAN